MSKKPTLKPVPTDGLSKLLKIEKLAEPNLSVPAKQKLNPIDPHKRLIDKMQQLTMNDSTRSLGKPLLDDSITKKSGKLDMSKSMINFDDGEDEYMNRQGKSEDLFNNLVKNNIILEFHEVNGFLLSIGMEKYFDTFIQNGLDSIEKVKSTYNVLIYIDTSEEVLKFVPYGHRAKMMKRIKEMATTTTIRPVQNNVYEELPMAMEFNSIEDIEAYEAEQRRLFQQAVAQFRSGGDTDTVETKGGLVVNVHPEDADTQIVRLKVIYRTDKDSFIMSAIQCSISTTLSIKMTLELDQRHSSQ
jgi:hypothetical protein